MKNAIRWSVLASAVLFAAAALAAPTKVDPKKFRTTKSGLKYAIIKTGKGKPAKAGQHVFVHYTGWLASNGKKFDSSLDHGQPFDFDLGGGQVIKGWDEGVQGMLPGEKRQLIIPSGLGYGDDGHPPVIPPKATLIFDVEFLKAQ